MIFDISIYPNAKKSPINTPDTPSKKPAQRWKTYTNDMRSPSLGSKHAQDPRSASNIEHRLAFEEMFVIDDRGSVRSRSDGILQHLFVDACSKSENPQDNNVRSHA
jgi:hypothetical protein